MNPGCRLAAHKAAAPAIASTRSRPRLQHFSPVCSLRITPARTCTEAAAQARAALRRYREALRQPAGAAPDAAAGAEGGGQQQAAALPRRLTVRLPLPSPGRGDDGLHNYDQADWPGGIQQRFRRLRPLVEETLLAGYEPQFVGMLESPADGIGVWRAAGGDTTVVAQVGNQNFSPFARLCAGEFGTGVLDPGHTLVVVNPTWTRSADIGQLWDRKLRAAAAALIDDPAAWLPLYHLWDLRTAKGATGLLFRAWPHDWQLYHTTTHQEDPAAALDDPPICVSPERPSQERQIELLNAALQEGLQQERAAKQAGRRPGR